MMADFFGDDNICRLGGDEFLILIPDKTEEEAENMLEEACQKMKETFKRAECADPAIGQLWGGGGGKTAVCARI